jgi:hypothetical protein
MVARTTLIAAAALPQLETVTRFLRAKKRRSLEDCLDWLRVKRQEFQGAVILNALNPGRLYRLDMRVEKDDAFVYCDSPLLDACLREINNLAPLDMDMMEMRYGEANCPDELYPASCGFPMGWDEWEEIIDNIESISPNTYLYLFVTMLRMGENEKMALAAQEIGWELSEEECATLPNPDWNELLILLEQRGLEVFKNAINVCLYDTGNPYFDYNPWDESDIYSLPAFTLGGVRELQQFWEEAQPISADLDKAVLQFGQDPTLARTIFDLCVESQGHPAPRPQTLAEIWAGEADDAEVVTDEFYGPMGLEA